MTKFNNIYLEYRSKIKEELIYFQGDHVDPEEDFDGDEEDIFDKLDDLENNSPLNLLKGKGVVAVYLHNDDIASALYFEDDEENDLITFDIIVSKDYQNKGYGTKLIDVAKEEFKKRKDSNDRMKIRVDVTNEKMKDALERKGFDIEEEDNESGRWIMGIKDPLDKIDPAEIESPKEDFPVEESIGF